MLIDKTPAYFVPFNQKSNSVFAIHVQLATQSPYKTTTFSNLSNNRQVFTLIYTSSHLHIFTLNRPKKNPANAGFFQTTNKQFTYLIILLPKRKSVYHLLSLVILRWRVPLLYPYQQDHLLLL